MTHLLRIHIGPVQEFIAAARRSRDLWYGSWLLSELSKAAALGVVEAESANLHALIFPAPQSLADLQPDSDYGVVNEIVALIEGSPRDVAHAARDKLNSRLTGLAAAALDPLGDIIHRADADAQLRELVEFYWVAVPFTDYEASRELADRLLAARKNTRTFAPVSWGDKGPPRRKSSLDGARESVIIGDTQDAGRMYQRFKARPGEELSGVDLLKRLGQAGAQQTFPSTSHMAALPLRDALAEAATNPQATAAWEAYRQTLPGTVLQQETIQHDLKLPLLGDLDGGLLFASRLTDHLAGQALKTAEQALPTFYNRAGLEPPLPYYALLVGDGDFMGRTITTLTTATKNQSFSHALAGFADQAKTIIAGRSGAVVFAGGDDVMALLPLHTAVQCAAELADTFYQSLQPFGHTGQSPTFSAGIAIVHHLEPLEDALALARRAERTAKRIRDGHKNALAVALDKRGGAPRLVVGHWGDLDRRLLHLAAYHQNGLIPDRLAYQLLDTYHLLGGIETTAAGQSLRPILALEAERITGRKQVEGGSAAVDQRAQQYILETMSATTDATIPALADELVIAALLAQAATPAGVAYPFPPQEETHP
jgi:CRISPR-associated protein Cmr2